MSIEGRIATKIAKNERKSTDKPELVPGIDPPKIKRRKRKSVKSENQKPGEDDEVFPHLRTAEGGVSVDCMEGL